MNKYNKLFEKYMIICHNHIKSGNIAQVLKITDKLFRLNNQAINDFFEINYNKDHIDMDALSTIYIRLGIILINNERMNYYHVQKIMQGIKKIEDYYTDDYVSVNLKAQKIILELKYLKEKIDRYEKKDIANIIKELIDIEKGCK